MTGVLDHGSTFRIRRAGRDRLRIALGLALVEGVLVVVGVLDWWFVVLVAVAAAALYWTVGRSHARPAVRSLTWIAAVSQLTVVVVPLLVTALIGIVAGLVILAAIGGLAFLIVERRR